MNGRLSMDDDSFERDLFRERAQRMELPALPSVDAVIARGETRRCVRAVSLLPGGSLKRVYRALATTVAPVAMLHAAAGLFVLVAWGSGVHGERVHTDAPPSERPPAISLSMSGEPEGDRGTCGPASFFGLTCEALPASMPVASHAAPGSCDAPLESIALVGSGGARLISAASVAGVGDAICGCGDFVTCADDRP